MVISILWPLCYISYSSRWSRFYSVYVQRGTKSCYRTWELRLTIFQNWRWKNLSTRFWWPKLRFWKRLLCSIFILELKYAFVASFLLFSHFFYVPICNLQVGRPIGVHVQLIEQGMLCYTHFMVKQWSTILSFLLNILHWTFSWIMKVYNFFFSLLIAVAFWFVVFWHHGRPKMCG